MIAYYQTQSSSTIIHSIIQELKPTLQLLQLSLPRGSTLFWRATRVTLAHVLVSSYTRRFFFLICFFHFHRTLFRGHAGACVNPESFFSNSLFVHSFLCQITHSFLNGF